MLKIPAMHRLEQIFSYKDILVACDRNNATRLSIIINMISFVYVKLTAKYCLP